MRLDLFVKLKYESGTIILFVGIRYSMPDLLSDLNNYAWPANYSDMHIRYGKWYQRFLWRQLALESCEFHTKTIF